MAYTTIFFDLDGTIIDPKDSITKSAQYTLSKFGINENLAALKPFVGPPLNDSLKKYYNFNDKQAKQAAKYYRKHFLENGIREIMLYEGIIELLKKLKAKNKTLCIVSTKFNVSAQKIVVEHELSTYFDNIIATKPDESNADK